MHRDRNFGNGPEVADTVLQLMRSALILSLLVALLGAGSAAAAKPTQKKAMWGPLSLPSGASAFPTYRDLGVGIFQMHLAWQDVAPDRPGRPRDPSDPAYKWPAGIDYALSEARANGIQVLLMLIGAPPWANGGNDWRYAPKPSDFADFAYAASRRWPGVKYWMVWGEPCRGNNWRPLVGEPAGQRGKPLNAEQRKAPELYAREVDAVYGALKSAQRTDLVIGGNCYTGPGNRAVNGDVTPLNWMRYMRLPNGRPPRMDLYGHNPVTARRPDLKRRQLAPGTADFSDLDVFAKWLDRYQRKGLRMFLSEFFLQTDHFGSEAPYYVTRKTAADWATQALRITRRWNRIYSFGWLQLIDLPPNASGDEQAYGLLDWQGRRKPAYAAFRDG